MRSRLRLCFGLALTLQMLIERIQDDVSSINLNVWYLDDSNLLGSPEDLAAALCIVELTRPSLGFHLNRGKSLLYIPQGDASPSPIPADILITSGGFSMLGCPIGPPSYCEEMLQCRISMIRDCLAEDSPATLLPHPPQIGLCLKHWPIPLHRPGDQDFDALVRESLETILGGLYFRVESAQCFLPSTLGGINVQSASLHAPAACVASSLSSETFVCEMLGEPVDHSADLRPALVAFFISACLTSGLGVPWGYWCATTSTPPFWAIDKAAQAQVLSSAPLTRSCALVLSTSLPHAVHWLNGVAYPTLGLHLEDWEFRCCLRYWLGVNLHNSHYFCPECRGAADQFGDHQVSCEGGRWQDNASQSHLWCPVWGGTVSSTFHNSWGFRSGGSCLLKTSWQPPSYMTK